MYVLGGGEEETCANRNAITWLGIYLKTGGERIFKTAPFDVWLRP